MAHMNPKPSIPEGYTIPQVWKYNEETMKPVHGSNIPKSGPQSDKELPRGSHDIQLYGLGTGNGVKASIMLEELVEMDETFDYDAYTINIMKGDQFTSGFVAVNPNSKIPAIFDQSTGARVFESGAILVYLAEKYGKLMPTDLAKKAECLSWVFFQVGAGPYYGGGGLSHFKGRAPKNWEYAIDRYTIETKRILDVLDKALEGKQYLCGDEYTIADIMHWKWTSGLISQEYLDGASYSNLQRWSKTVAERPAVKRGERVLGWGSDAIPERHSRADTN
ncbi:GST-like protein SMU_1296 [Seminavis robusta]|uniref:GST-like protein SMU_1296 n=1 Tax=Seminavis robusta TaxID=568900 RepID=A0A9N8D8N8_9STRA|nr:GST-like protein SMU_1296 [Seminavis robusta]|eukprot:Sro32_g020960.1 GST-like protein SMU_1296 (277) ;mRNA; f:120125-121068